MFKWYLVVHSTTNTTDIAVNLVKTSYWYL